MAAGNSINNKDKEIASNNTTELSQRALFVMVLLALQFGLQPLLTRKYTSPDITKSTVLLVQEVVKGFLALGMLILSGQASKAWQGR